MGWLARYLHSKGFGIHSPFAYRFITEVLNEKWPYYDYHNLKHYYQTVIYRCAVYFRPNGLVSLGHGDIAPAKMACPRSMVKKYFGDHDEMAVAGMYAKVNDLLKAIDAEAPIVGYNVPKDVIAQVKARMDENGCGMTFDNHHDMVIIVPDPKLPRQDIEVRF